MEEELTCEHCGRECTDQSDLWNHPCPGRVTTIQRPSVYYEDRAPHDPTVEPTKITRELPAVGSIMDRPNGRKAKVVQAVEENGVQRIGLTYVS